MPNIIKHKRNSVAGTVPATGVLDQGELAINVGDGKLYTKNTSNNIINLGVTSISGTSITPSSGNFSNYLAVNGVPVSVSGHSHTSVPQAQSLVTSVFNKTGSSIPKFSVVYINGGQGDQPTIQLAIASNEAGSSKTYGVTAETISNMSSGNVVVAGALTGLNTDQFNPNAPTGDVNGTSLWLSPTVSGSVTTTKPYASNHVVFVGTIVRTHQNAGVVEVRVQNGYELEELHNVAVSGVSGGQFLYYNSSSGLWQPNPNIYSVGGSIGIGTNSPYGTLDVYGTIVAGNNTLGRLKIGDDNYGGDLGILINTDEALAIKYNDGSFRYGETYPGASDAIVVSSGKNIGIGTAYPSAQLHVIGSGIISNDLTVGGNLTVNGSVVTANVDRMEIEDPIITLGLASGNIVTTNTLDRGLALVRGTGLTAFMGWDTSASQFVMLSSGVSSNSSGNYDAGIYGDLQINNLNSSRVYSSRLDLNDGINSSFISCGAEGDTRFLVSSNGALGIGSAMPSTIDSAPFYISPNGSVTNGTWNASTIAVNKGGTGRTTYSNGQILIGSGTSLVANTLTAGTGISITNGSGTIRIDSNIADPVTGTGVANHVAYWNSSSGIVADSGQLYWDATNNRLGIGTNSPLDLIHISGATASSIGIRFDNNDGHGGSVQADNGQLYLNSSTATAARLSGRKIRLGDGGASACAIELSSVGTISQDGNGGGLSFSGTTGQFSNGLHVTAGNVGIGTTSPSYTLDVSGTIGVSGIARFNNDIYMLDPTKRISWDNGTEYIGRQGDSIIIGTQSATRILVNSIGSVGIGTEVPGATLDVRGSAIFNEVGADVDFRVEGDTDTNLLFIDASTDRVGIGTSTPSDKLNIVGNISAGTLSNTQGKFIAYGSASQPNLLFEGFGTDGTARISTNSGANRQLKIENDGASNTLGVYIEGDVGIGTTTPGYKLQVAGSFGATTKSFRIDHPSKKGYSLEYGSLESPYHGVRLTGRGKVIKGVGTVDLPDYLKDLIHDDESIVIQLSNYKHGKTLYVSNIDLQNDKFIVKADRAKSLGELEFFWTLTGVRKDVDHLVVEKEN